MNRIFDLAKKYEPELVEFMRNLVKTKSLSGEERDVVELIGNEMEKVGFDKVFTDDLGNIIGVVGDGRTRIAMDAHIDTVDVGNPDLWERDPFSGDYDGEWVYGRGASDQKAGMASMVYGVKVLKEMDLLDDFTLYVVGSIMEEDCDGLCWQFIINEGVIKPDYVLITEPTNLGIYRGHRGRIEFRIRTKGLSAHASAPERGENAIYKMAKIINEIERLNEELESTSFLGKGTVAVTQIFFKSPSQNAVPDECTIHIDRRLTEGEDKEKAFNEMRRIFEKVGVDAEILELEYDKPSYKNKIYKVKKYFPTWLMEEDHILVRSAVENYVELFGEKPRMGKWDFSTNGVATAGIFKIPTVGFGPGDEKFAHAPNEKVRVSDLIKASAFYANFPRTLVRSLRNCGGEKNGG